jgi:hypothetical protein
MSHQVDEMSITPDDHHNGSSSVAHEPLLSREECDFPLLFYHTSPDNR